MASKKEQRDERVEELKKSVEDLKEPVKAFTERVKKTVGKESEVKVFVEYGEKQLSTEDLAARAKEAYLGANPLAEIKTLELYVKPEEGAAYYVVNGEASPEFKLVF